MRHSAGSCTALLDANVLYPFLVRDLLLSSAQPGLFRPCWSRQIVEEWTHNLIARRPDKEEPIRRTVVVMERAFPEALVEGHEGLIGMLELPDIQDRHVLAAAIKADADVIVTENLGDFPASALAPFDIEAKTADDFLLSLFEQDAAEALAAVRTMRQRYQRPPYSGSALVLAMQRAGLVRTSAQLKPHVESI